MALVNMKSKAEKNECSPAEEAGDQPQYPYGLCINLDKDSLEKLGITSLPKVGTEMTINAKAVVKSVSAYDTQGEGQDMNASIQITDMEISGSDNADNSKRADMLYGG